MMQEWKRPEDGPSSSSINSEKWPGRVKLGLDYHFFFGGGDTASIS
jgi:hypothetical protein